MKGKVAVLGSCDFVMPFSALGVDTYPVGGGAGDVVENAQKILGRKYALIVIAENVAAEAEEIFSAEQKEAVPCIIVVPFTTEPTGVATQSLSTVIKMATGINILEKS